MPRRRHDLAGGPWLTTALAFASLGASAACSDILGIKEFASTGLGASTLAMASCAPGGAGLGDCGASHEDCCTSPEVPGGTYYRTYTTGDGDGGLDDGGLDDGGFAADAATGEGPSGEADPATLSGFRMDKYLVTVGRFRQFANAWTEGYTPSAGSGKHSHLNGGQGLANAAAPGTYESGWLASYDSNVAPTDANLGSCSPGGTWTPRAGAQENLPINCVTWWEAYAFCIWDGGFLPSEAEWEYVAAGGSQQREYPWGSMDPGTDNLYAIYGKDIPAAEAEAGMVFGPYCYYPTGSLEECTSVANIAPVGTATLGAARWGQLDMVGDVPVWIADWYAAYVDPCTDCAYLSATSQQDLRGGDFGDDAAYLLSAYRGAVMLTGRFADSGVRCARTP